MQSIGASVTFCCALSAFLDVSSSGPEYNFFQHVLNLFDPDISLNVTLSGYTNQSVAITNDTSGGYSACVYDVAVGNYDVCIADLWITPEPCN